MVAEVIAVGMAGVLISGLLWLRLLAAGAKPKQAGQVMAAVWFLAAAFLWGVTMVTGGWREGDSRRTAIGVAISVGAVWSLRRFLQRVWERFPLT